MTSVSPITTMTHSKRLANWTLVCFALLISLAQALQTLQWASSSRAEQSSVQIKLVNEQYRLTTGTPIYTVFEDHDQTTVYDVALKVRLSFDKHVNLPVFCIL